MSVGTNIPEGGLQFATHQFHQGRLAGSIGTHQGNTTVQIDTKGYIIVEWFTIGIGKGDVSKGQHGRRQLTGIGKMKIERLFFFRLFRQATPNHFLQNLFLGLGLFGILGCTVSKAGNVFLHALDLILFPLVLFHLILLLFSFRLDKLIVITIVIHQLFLIGKVDHVRADIIQKVLRMRYQQENLIPVRKILLQPNDGLHIQVIGGFIQEQNMGHVSSQFGKHDTRALSIG
mmetsp:Transcript_22510/g.51906  ORF Transcript_22510/g.51906 Transcript_22510/m.51906 type:complete len:231 (+) Transcript_22510:271-963(+)